jgi:DNA-binding transcriptional LysR family regulator
MAEPVIETLDLLVFTSVAQLGSFSAAAAELRLATPSVSARIAALERRVGARLFDRGARGSTLTPAGQRLVGYARRCLDLLDEAAAGLGTGPADRLVLAAPHSLASAVFPLALGALAARGVAVHGLVAHSREVVELVRDGRAHGGFIVTQAGTGTLHTERLGSSPIVAVCAAGHELTRRGRLHIDDLVESTLVVFRWDAEGEPVARAFESPRRRSEHLVHTTGSPDSAIQLAIDRGYVAVVPQFAAARSLRDGSTSRLPITLPRWTVGLRFIYAGASHDRAGLSTFLESIPDIKEQLTAAGAPDHRSADTATSTGERTGPARARPTPGR